MTLSRLREGDKVAVISGKHKGERGQVLKFFTDDNRVLVEGVNVVKRHQKSRMTGQPGEIVEREAPIHASNVMHIDPKSDKPTRIRVQVAEDGTKVRVSTRSGEVIESAEA